MPLQETTTPTTCTYYTKRVVGSLGELFLHVFGITYGVYTLGNYESDDLAWGLIGCSATGLILKIIEMGSFWAPSCKGDDACVNYYFGPTVLSLQFALTSVALGLLINYYEGFDFFV